MPLHSSFHRPWPFTVCGSTDHVRRPYPFLSLIHSHASRIIGLSASSQIRSAVKVKAVRS